MHKLWSCRATWLALLSCSVLTNNIPSMAVDGKSPAVEDRQFVESDKAIDKPGSRATSLFEQLYPYRGSAGQQYRIGYIDRTGTVICQPQFDKGFPFTEGLGAIELAGKWGFIDAGGTIVIQPQFDGFRAFSEGLAAVNLAGQWSYIDKQGNLKTQAQFDQALSFSEGLAPVRIGDKWGFVDYQMQLAIPAAFDAAWRFTQGRAPVKVNNRWGFIDATGQIVIQPVYYWVDSFSEGLAFVEGGMGNEGYIDLSGNFVIQRRFYGANPFSDGVAAVMNNPGGTWDIMNDSGEMISNYRFEDNVGLFYDGLAWFINSSYSYLGYIDNTAAIRISNLRNANNFSGGLALVYNQNYRQSYIDTTGIAVWTEPSQANASRSEESSITPDPETATLNTMIKDQAEVPPLEISLVGNPYRQRWPDDSGSLVYSRNIRDMVFYRARIYTGAGDYVNNTGPVDIYSFAPGTSEFLWEYQAREEVVSVFYIFDDRLVVPGNDPQESWEWGNIYIKENGVWRKMRTIPNGLHCWELAYLEDTLFAIVYTEHASRVLSSRDWCVTWENLVYDALPSFMYIYENDLYSRVWNSLYQEAISLFFGSYDNGVFYSEAAIPRLQLLSKEPVAYPSPYGQTSFAGAVQFGDDVVLRTTRNTSDPNGGPYPLYVRHQNRGEPVMVDIFANENVLDLVIHEEVLYVLCTHKQDDHYENAIYSTDNLQDWTCWVTFSTDSFARSFVLACGSFYVSIGCSWPDGGQLPASTGDILKIVPTAPLPLERPHILLDRHSIDVSTEYGINPEAGTFTITHDGCSTLNYTVTDDADWLTVLPEDGSASGGETDTIQIVYDVTGLLPLQHVSAIISVIDPNADNWPQTISVDLDIQAVAGDFDEDGDVDQSEFGHLQACFSGHGLLQSAPDCQDAKLDGDAYVDQSDVSIFLRCMSGSNVLADPNCAN